MQWFSAISLKRCLSSILSADETSEQRKRAALSPLSAKDEEPPESGLYKKALPNFWDNLSKVLLSTGALQELDRRTTQPVPPRSPDRSSLKSEHSTALKHFARHGGPNLDDLRGYSKLKGKTMGQNLTSLVKSLLDHAVGYLTVSSAAVKKTSPYDPNFELHLIDHGVYPNAHSSNEPGNLDSIRNKLAQRRQSLSIETFGQEAFLDFKQEENAALNEATVTSIIIPVIFGRNCTLSSLKLRFLNLASLTDGSLTAPEPDVYSGSHPAELHRRARDELSTYIAPSRNLKADLLPNFFLEIKGPDGRMTVLKRQACYDGAIGARAMHRLRSFTPQQGNHHDDSRRCCGDAFTITATYGVGKLDIYVAHVTRSAARTDNNLNNTTAGGCCCCDYHWTHVGTWFLTGSWQQFCEGVTAIRNAFDWAKEQRDEAIALANWACQ